MVKVKRCLDTYALVEIANGNPKFAHYLNLNFVITEWTLVEFYWVLLRDADKETAEVWHGKLEPYVLAVDKFVLKEAVEFRYEHKKSDISIFDAVGYVFSLRNGYYFVTGDKEFEKFVNVEFRKK